AGREDQARRLLDRGAEHCNSAWPLPVFRYLRHEIDAKALLDTACDNDKMTEARTDLGLDLMLTGRTDEAIEHFRWVQEHGNKDFGEYLIAVAELKRLQGKPSGNTGN